jgi:hypothetical protein
MGCSLALACCGSPALPYKPAAILTVDAHAETVHLDLVAAATNDFSGFNFDGYGGGEMRVRVPRGWTVDVRCTNDSTALTHSCAIADDLPISPNGGPIAFPGATTPDPTDGLAYAKSASFSFIATRTGNFRIVCLVTGHEADGMWDWLTVTNGGTPSVTV